MTGRVTIGVILAAALVAVAIVLLPWWDGSRKYDFAKALAGTGLGSKQGVAWGDGGTYLHILAALGFCVAIVAAAPKGRSAAVTVFALGAAWASQWPGPASGAGRDDRGAAGPPPGAGPPPPADPS